MQRHIVCFFELFTNVEKVDFTSRNHDSDQRSVIGAKTLRKRIFLWPTLSQTLKPNVF